MLLTIVGWFYIIFGLLYLIKPAWLQNRLKKKNNKKLRRIFFFLALSISLLIIKATWGMEGAIPKVLMVMGIVGIFKALFFLKAKSAEKMIEWWMNRPVNFYRGWSILMLAFGAFLAYIE